MSFSNSAAVEIARPPDSSDGMLMASLEFGQNALSGVVATGGADLPEDFCIIFRIGPGCAELRAMEDWFAAS